MRTVERDGKEITVLESFEEMGTYAGNLARAGGKGHYAEKSGRVLAARLEPGEKLPVWTENGNLEAMETVQEGKLVLTRAGDDGQPVVDRYGHVNQWQVDEATARKKYELPEVIGDEPVFAKPAGGEQVFMETDRDLILMEPWGSPEQPMVEQFVPKGGFLNVTKPGEIYGIAAEEFAATYRVNKVDDPPLVKRKMPDTPAVAGPSGPELGLGG